MEGKVLNFLAWFTGIVVSLVVGSAMTNGILSLPWWLGGATQVGMAVTVAVGWVIIVTTLVGAVMAVIRR